MLQNNEIDKYIKTISKQIPYKSDETKKFIDDLKSNINNYVEDNQVKDIAEIKLQFGTEDEIANAFLETVNIKTVKRKISIKRLLICFVVAVITIWSIGVIIGTIQSNNANSTYIHYSQIADESDSLNTTQEL